MTENSSSWGMRLFYLTPLAAPTAAQMLLPARHGNRQLPGEGDLTKQSLRQRLHGRRLDAVHAHIGWRSRVSQPIVRHSQRHRDHANVVVEQSVDQRRLAGMHRRVDGADDD